MDSYPLISALMLTNAHPWRLPLTEVAIQCFLKQTYPNKELIIINSGDTIPVDSPLIRQFHANSVLTTGELRNLALGYAEGEILIQWDDDDWCCQNRIQFQYEALTPNSIVLLKNQFRYDLTRNEVISVCWPQGIFGTMMWNISNYHFPSLRLGEDRLFVECFPGRRKVLNNSPAMYLRSFHGLNLSSRSHVMECSGVMPLQPSELDLRRLMAASVWPLSKFRPQA